MGHSAKQFMWAGAAFGAIVLGMYAIHHERQIGRDEVRAEDAKANAAAQAIADKGAADANAALHARGDALTQPILDLGAIYADKARVSDCSPVVYVRRQQLPNKAKPAH